MAAGDWDDPGPQLAVELGGEAAGGPTNIDDEYRWAGVEDPKIVITTSRDPSSKLKQFAKVGMESVNLTAHEMFYDNMLCFFVMCLSPEAFHFAKVGVEGGKVGSTLGIL